MMHGQKYIKLSGVLQTVAAATGVCHGFWIE